MALPPNGGGRGREFACYNTRALQSHGPYYPETSINPGVLASSLPPFLPLHHLTHPSSYTHPHITASMRRSMSTPDLSVSHSPNGSPMGSTTISSGSPNSDAPVTPANPESAGPSIASSGSPRPDPLAYVLLQKLAQPDGTQRMPYNLRPFPLESDRAILREFGSPLRPVAATTMMNDLIQKPLALPEPFQRGRGMAKAMVQGHIKRRQKNTISNRKSEPAAVRSQG